MMRSRQHMIVVSAAMWLAAAVVPSSSAGAELRVMRVDPSEFPTVRIGLYADDLPNDAPLPSVSVNEGGRVAEVVTAHRGRIGHVRASRSTSMVIALDTSMSMAGTKLERAVEAARLVAGAAGARDAIGLVAIDGDVRTVLKPTTDRRAFIRALEGLELGRGTLLFDGAATAAGITDPLADDRVVVLIGDGEDTGSELGAKSAARAVREADASVFAVGIDEGYFDPANLRAIADDTGGELRLVSNADELPALLQQLGRELLGGFWIEYRSMAPRGETLGVTVETSLGAATAALDVPALPADRARSDKPAAAAASASGGGAVPDTALGRAVVAMPFLLATFIVMNGVRRGTAARRRAELLAPYVTGAEGSVPSSMRRVGLLSSIMRHAEDRVSESRTRHIELRLDRANVPLRVAEYIILRVALSGLGVLGWASIGGLVGFLLLFAGVVGPYLFIKQRIRRRRKAFDEQLPDLLTSIASSLRAGHSFGQGLTAAIGTAPDPLKMEFERALAESSLGVPLEQALEAMVERLESRELGFLVSTVAIQRQVGGSLAVMVEMLTATIRDRHTFAKKVAALTSQGRASAWVLLVMPFAMALGMNAINPEFMRPLLDTRTGHMVMLACVVWMSIGAVVIRRIVSFKG